MNITIKPLPPEKHRHPKDFFDNPGFGRTFTNRMFKVYYKIDRGWYNPEISPYEPFVLDPAAMVFHYAQSIFEGFKAYKWADGRIAMFRPEENAKRFMRSAHRMAMPSFPAEDLLQAVDTLVGLEHEWVPDQRGSSLYVRPFMFATEVALGVKPSSSYIVCIILSVVGSYFAIGYQPITAYVTRDYVRAVRGGIGAAKTAGNYAASLFPQREAKEKGCDQVIYLDALQLKYIEEMGGMNVFFVIEGDLVTPPLEGSILDGITRDSILKIAPNLGLKAIERPVSIEEVLERAEDGTLQEALAVGTAAVVTPIKTIKYMNKDIHIGPRDGGPIAKILYDALTDIQYGRVEEKYNWTRIVNPLT